MSKMLRSTIGEICDRFSSGKTISSSQISETGLYPVYGGNGLRGYTDTYNFEGECAIIGRQGAYCGNVRYFGGKAYMTEHAIVACAKKEHSTGYLAYKLSLMNLSQYQGQSAQPGLSVNTLSKLELDMPTLKVQNSIFSVLNKIEKKIESNKKINSELNKMTEMIYDYWFLQFDFPNEEGKPYKSSGGKMVWNEELKREIPEGWYSRKLSDISKIELNSISPQKDKIYKHYSIPAYDENKMPVLEKGESISSNKYIVPNDAILVSKLNPQFKRLWLLQGNVIDGICSTEFMPFVSAVDNKEFLFAVLNSDGFYKFMVQSSSSSTGSRKRMQPELMGEYRFAYPCDSNVLSMFKSVTQPNLEEIIRIREENQELMQLRDFLLPLLMNGQVSFDKETFNK